MIPAFWSTPPGALLWQVVLHSLIVGGICLAWARRERLPPGPSRRRLLGLVLVLPLITAAIPGRASPEFRGRIAWLDSGPMLAIPLVAGYRVYHLVFAAALLAVAATLWQEVLPVLRRRTPAGAPPELLERLARALPAWPKGPVAIDASEGIVLATGGWPWRRRLIVSRGAIERLSEAELLAALRHESAHWQRGRWWRAHALFGLRLLQCYNPVALWAFRAYCQELEIECDAEAARAEDHRTLAGALLKIYESTDRRDVAARSALRWRVDALLADGRDDGTRLPLPTLAVASTVLALALPWVV